MTFSNLPWPPSVNAYWTRTKSGMRRSDAATTYLAEVLAAVNRNRGRTITGRVGLRIKAYPPDCRVRDLDNTLKAICDALKVAHVYADDSQIDSLAIDRCQVVAGGRISVAVEDLGSGS